MKKVLILSIIFLLVASFAFTLDVNKLTGQEWERLDQVSETSKHDIVSGVLAGFGMVKDFTYDLHPAIPKKYDSFEEFVEKEYVVEKIVHTLDKYYKNNRDTYKYDDRVVTMIIVIFGKYWW